MSKWHHKLSETPLPWAVPNDEEHSVPISLSSIYGFHDDEHEDGFLLSCSTVYSG